MIPDGYTDLAPGKIASVVTYLEMLERPVLADISSSAVQTETCNCARCKIPGSIGIAPSFAERAPSGSGSAAWR